MCFGLLCCAGAAVCCAGQACCGLLCAPCKRAGVPAKNFARIGFVVFQILWIAVAIIMLFSVKKLIEILPSFMQCPEESGDGSACMGTSAIIRMSFVLACFHFMVLLIILARNSCAAMFHDGFWMLKFLFVLIFFIASTWIPLSFFEGYMSFARIVSIFFLIYQALLMLVVAYKINATMVGNYEADQGGCSAVILLILTGVITAGNITWAVFQYIWYYSCAYNDVIITITNVAGIAFYILVFFRTRNDASILTSSIVFTYCLYLQWSALASNPSTSCNPFNASAGNTVAQIVVGLFFTLVSLLIISGSTRKEGEGNIATSVNVAVLESEEDTGERVDDVENKNGERVTAEDSHTFPVTTQTIFFQLLLVLASVYYCMLLTNWGNPTVFQDTTDFFEANGTSFWIKIVAEWISIAIYLFSLLAPLLFPNRDFS